MDGLIIIRGDYVPKLYRFNLSSNDGILGICLDHDCFDSMTALILVLILVEVVRSGIRVTAVWYGEERVYMIDFSQLCLTIVDGTEMSNVKSRVCFEWRVKGKKPNRSSKRKCRTIFCLAGGDWQVLSTERTLNSDGSILIARTNMTIVSYCM
jgi:hypothetical protein